MDAVYLYLDAFALRVRSAGKVVSMLVLGVVGVRSDGASIYWAWSYAAAFERKAPKHVLAGRLRVEDASNHERNRRLHEEFRRRVKAQCSLPGEDAALILLFSPVVSGQIKLRRIDG